MVNVITKILKLLVYYKKLTAEIRIVMGTYRLDFFIYISVIQLLFIIVMLSWLYWF
jgi:hypothetical protein